MRRQKILLILLTTVVSMPAHAAKASSGVKGPSTMRVYTGTIADLKTTKGPNVQQEKCLYLKAQPVKTAVPRVKNNWLRSLPSTNSKVKTPQVSSKANSSSRTSSK